MKCYYHQDREAVGLCKSCNKGLCCHCVADVGNGLACRDRCEEQVLIVNAITDYSARYIPKASSMLRNQRLAWLGMGLFLSMAGAVYVGLGILANSLLQAVLFGGPLCFGGLLGFVMAYRSPQVNEKHIEQTPDMDLDS